MKNKLQNIDFYRLITSFLIIAIHIDPFLSINKNINFIFTHIICRIGVPFFLIITGYFILPVALKDINKLKNYTQKIIIIYLISITLYTPVKIFAGFYNDITIIEVLKNIFLDGTFYHLWYFPSLILGIWLTYYILKKTKEKNALIVLIILYIIGLFGDSYYGLIENLPVINSLYNLIFKIFDYTRNGLFFIPIFLLIGYKQKTKNQINLKRNIFFIILFTILMIIEGLILKHYNLQKHDSMYITLIPLMYYLSALLLKMNIGQNKKLRTISTLIYIIHPIMIIIIRYIGKLLNIETLIITNTFIHYILVSSFSFIISYIIYKIMSKFKKLKLLKITN